MDIFSLLRWMVGWNVSFAFNLDAVDAATHAKIQEKWQNQLSTKTPLFLKSKERGGFHMYDGGDELVFPVVLQNGVAASYYGDDIFDTSRQGGLQKLTYQVRQFYSQVRVDGIEEILNSGSAAAADVLDGRFMQSEITTAENFEEMSFGDGTGNVGGDGVARDWNGFQNLIADDPTTGTIGTLSRTTFPNLRNQAYTTAVTGFNTAQAGRIALITLWQDCTRGLRSPNWIVATGLIWRLYNLSLTANERFEMQSNPGTLGKAGFKTLQFNGMEFVESEFCPADHLYMVRWARPRSDGGIFFLIHRSRNFKLGPFRIPTDGDYRVAYSLTAGQLGSDGPSLSGVATNITG